MIPGEGNSNPLREIPCTEEPGMLQSMGSQKVSNTIVLDTFCDPFNDKQNLNNNKQHMKNFP